MGAAERLALVPAQPAAASLAAALLLGVALGFPTVTYLWLTAAANASKAEEQGRLAEHNLKEARQAVHKHFLDLSEIELSKEDNGGSPRAWTPVAADLLVRFVLLASTTSTP